MPMWDYKCNTCKKTKEFILRISDVTDFKCCTITEQCGGTMARQKVALTNWIPGKTFHNNGYVSN